jgi:hypothetical protein
LIDERAVVAWIPIDNPEEARAIENDLIRRFDPSLNWTPCPIHSTRMSMLTVRVPAWVAEFYERQAETERRKLSDVIRIILVDHAEKRRAA